MPWNEELGVPKPGNKSGSGGGESSMKLEWPSASLPHYAPGNLQDSPKMVILLELVFRSVKMGEKILIFRYSGVLMKMLYVEGILTSLEEVMVCFYCSCCRVWDNFFYSQNFFSNIQQILLLIASFFFIPFFLLGM